MKSMAKGPGKRAHTSCPADANVLFDTKEQSSASSNDIATAPSVGTDIDIASIRANIAGVLNGQGRQHRQMSRAADVPMPKRCYVYAIYVDGVLRYFGKGTNGRMYAHMKEVRERLTREFKLKNISSLFQRKLTGAVMKGAVVEEVVLADNLTPKQAYKLEYRYLEKMVHDGKRLQLWNIIPPSIYTPQEYEAYLKKLTVNLRSKNRLARFFARMQLIRLGRYEDEPQSTRLRQSLGKTSPPMQRRNGPDLQAGR
jgi:hypothetical protein